MRLPSAQSIQSEIQEIETAMANPATSRNAAEMKRLSHEYSHKKELFEVLVQLEKVGQQLADAEELIEATDSDMRALAEEDIRVLTESNEKLLERVRGLLVPQDPMDNRDVILEIRAGAGGEEAALFAAELFRAYTRYGEDHGWSVHTVSSATSEQGGFKEIIAEISGTDVFGVLKFERGVHRVQRVPETEKQGRIHTSTVTVAVLPQAEVQDIEVRSEDLRVDTYRASGAGGQHVNKTSSAVRITHIPTGTVVAVQEERSQHKNREKAMKILRAKLLQEQEDKRISEVASARKEQVGRGDRSEKIRTYNYPQDRITDHRIKESWSNIEGVLNGQMSPLFTALRDDYINRLTNQL